MSENNKYTAEQFNLVTEFTDYGIEPEDIIFYDNKPEPFFTFEATCVLCNKLTDIKDIDIEQVTGFEGTTVYRCKLGFEDGKTRSAPGVVNHNETIEGQSMSEHQRIALASARAIRNALKASGINLLKAHHQLRSTGELAEPSLDLLRIKLLREVHQLGEEVGFIIGSDKTAWRNIIFRRFGVNSSKDLTDDQLADFAAFLRSCLPKAA